MPLSFPHRSTRERILKAGSTAASPALVATATADPRPGLVRSLTPRATRPSTGGRQPGGRSTGGGQGGGDLDGAPGPSSCSQLRGPAARHGVIEPASPAGELVLIHLGGTFRQPNDACQVHAELPVELARRYPPGEFAEESRETTEHGRLSLGELHRFLETQLHQRLGVPLRKQ